MSVYTSISKFHDTYVAQTTLFQKYMQIDACQKPLLWQGAWCRVHMSDRHSPKQKKTWHNNISLFITRARVRRSSSRRMSSMRVTSTTARIKNAQHLLRAVVLELHVGEWIRVFPRLDRSRGVSAQNLWVLYASNNKEGNNDAGNNKRK